jgi:hypothetical protein
MVREAEAHYMGGATWGRRGVAASRWSYSTRRKKGSLDSEDSTWEWPVDGAHRRGKLGRGGESDSSMRSDSPMVGVDKRSSGGVGLPFGASERKEVERKARACEWGKVGLRGHWWLK